MNIEAQAKKKADREVAAEKEMSRKQYGWAVHMAEHITKLLTDQGLTVAYVREKHFHGDVVWRHQGFGDDPCLIRVWPSSSAGRVEGQIGLLVPQALRRKVRPSDDWIPVDKELHSLVPICTDVLKHAIKASIE